MTRNATAVCILTMFILACTALGQYQISWYTVDGGGGHSAGGDFSLSGTIGQHDAGPSAGAMSGGACTLIGGFWPAAVLVCHCPGDMNGDGIKDALDIQQFTACLIGGGACSCADVDKITGVTIDDVAAFVADLIAGDSCPSS